MARKAVLITGASRGIGRAAAELFARRGYGVLINYRQDAGAAHELEKQLLDSGADALAVQADVAQEDQVLRMMEMAVKRFGFIDVLVNNAGIASQKLFTALTTEEWRRMMAVHVDGTFHCCREVLPAMIREKRGAIVNVASIWGLSGASCEVAYSTAKAAVIGMTKALAREVGPSGVRVNCVAPGVIDTAMNAAAGADILDMLAEETPLGRIGTAQEAAQAIAYLASEEASFITGQVLTVDGGFI
ncbi:MAG: elongation factor P 5-aminopentanone reductase [Acutalibacteraceae bacterium]